MMQDMLNIARREAQRVMARLAMPKTGIVTGYDPDNHCAKVQLQPENVETGWLPIRTPWAGNGWGMFCPPAPGDEVEVGFQEGGKQAGYIRLRAFGNRFRPLPVPSREFWLVHGSGSFLKFLNDGTVGLHAATAITSSAPIWNHTGDVHVDGEILATGDITDLDGTRGTVGHIREVYDIHTHPVSGPTTNVPNQQL